MKATTPSSSAPESSALIEAGEAGRDHDADPVAYRAPKTGRVNDIGFYSRRREIKQESSFSVLG